MMRDQGGALSQAWNFQGACISVDVTNNLGRTAPLFEGTAPVERLYN